MIFAPVQTVKNREYLIENLEYAVALHFMYYNFARPHKTLANPYPRTPAMAAGIDNHIWGIHEIVSLTEANH
jgi:hypothetical protein